MKLQELVSRFSFKTLSHHESLDYILPSGKMVEACRADDFGFFWPWIATGRLSEAQMRHACQRYLLGKTKSGQPMYWMIDEMMTPLDAHLGTAGWLSALLKLRTPLLHYWPVSHCLFGLHLLATTSRPNQSVGLVESEASAVILSELFPECLWMAYATIGHLDLDLLEPLAGRVVTIYPRTDSTMDNYLFFLDYAERVSRRHTLTLHIDTTLEQHANESQKARNIDILDYLYESLT